MSEKHACFLRELMGKSGRSDLQQVAAALLDQIPDSCELVIHDGALRSSVSRYKTAPYQLGAITLGALAKTNMTWDLAHELGHVEIGYDASKVGNYEHEMEAWRAGWRLVGQLCPSLAAAWETEFLERARNCLKTYAGGSGDGS